MENKKFHYQFVPQLPYAEFFGTDLGQKLLSSNLLVAENFEEFERIDGVIFREKRKQLYSGI